MVKKLSSKGQGLIEYLILVALIAVGTLGAIRVVGQSLGTKFAQVAKSLGADVQGEIARPQVTEQVWKKRDLRDFMNGSLKNGASSGDVSGE